MHEVTIGTPRLHLRCPTQADAPAVFQWASDRKVTRYVAYPRHKSIEDSRQWLQSVEESGPEALDFAFVRKEDGLVMGTGGVYHNPQRGWWVLGYNLRRDCWGQGYATEAARAMIDYAHRTLGAKVFVADHAVGNPASGRVMEKCGMTFHHYGKFAKLDGSRTFKSKSYRLELE